MKDLILARTPYKYLPKGKKSKSPRNQVCRVNKDGPIVYLLYLKFTNHLPLSKNETNAANGITKFDLAGVFQTKKDAEYVCDCLNKIFKWCHVYDKQYRMDSPYWVDEMNNYYIVRGYYKMFGDVGRKKFMTERLLHIVTDKSQLEDYKKMSLNHLLGNNLNHLLGNKYWYLRKIFPTNVNKFHVESTIHVIRYKLNDVMPTMNLDDYSIQRHKQHMNIIINELYKYPHNKAIKTLISELKYLPPTKPLKTGGVEYQKMVNDPEFKKRWK